jgi:hypothetical protein
MKKLATVPVNPQRELGASGAAEDHRRGPPQRRKLLA